jgi:hypothetical protein
MRFVKSSVAADAGHVLNLRAGDLVEVRSEEEILRTLDSNGTLGSLPFMPEMLKFCGKQFRVYKRADKTCDTIEWQKDLRRMENAVHLEELRCDGAAHGGCQAGCLIHWREAWLKRVPEPLHAPASRTSDAGAGDGRTRETPVCTRETLMKATRVDAEETDDEVFSCQATELLRATTSPIPWWEPSQYLRDVRSGNVGVRQVTRGLLVGLFNKFQQVNARLFPRFCLIHGCRKYPFVEGKATSGEVPRSVLDLQPGEIVEVKSKDEIFATLDERDRNHGLRYDSEMLKYSGRQGKVLRRVERIINETTGRMIHIKRDCILLDGFICSGDYHRSCPRSIYTYWREIWLKRVDQPDEAAQPDSSGYEK